MTRIFVAAVNRYAALPVSAKWTLAILAFVASLVVAIIDRAVNQ